MDLGVIQSNNDIFRCEVQARHHPLIRGDMPLSASTTLIPRRLNHVFLLELRSVGDRASPAPPRWETGWWQPLPGECAGQFGGTLNRLIIGCFQMFLQRVPRTQARVRVDRARGDQVQAVVLRDPSHRVGVFLAEVFPSDIVVEEFAPTPRYLGRPSQCLGIVDERKDLSAKRKKDDRSAHTHLPRPAQRRKWTAYPQT